MGNYGYGDNSFIIFLILILLLLGTGGHHGYDK